MQKSAMFRKESLKKLSAQHETDVNIDIVKPAWWLIFAALALFASVMLVWCFMGSIPISYTSAGVIASGSQYALCCIPPYDMDDSIEIGTRASVLIGDENQARSGNIAYISQTPLSADEMAKESAIKDTKTNGMWLVNRLLEDDIEYAYLIAINMGDDGSTHTYDSIALISFVIDNERPIDMLLK